MCLEKNRQGRCTARVAPPTCGNQPTCPGLHQVLVDKGNCESSYSQRVDCYDTVMVRWQDNTVTLKRSGTLVSSLALAPPEQCVLTAELVSNMAALPNA